MVTRLAAESEVSAVLASASTDPASLVKAVGSRLLSFLGANAFGFDTGALATPKTTSALMVALSARLRTSSHQPTELIRRHVLEVMRFALPTIGDDERALVDEFGVEPLTPRAFYVTVDQPRSEPAPVASPEDPQIPLESMDPLEMMSGYGILLRRASLQPTPWRCLTFGNAALRELFASAPPVSAPRSSKPFATGLVVPFRGGYSEGVRQASIAYNGFPVGVRLPILSESSKSDPVGGKTVNKALARHSIDYVAILANRQDEHAISRAHEGDHAWHRLPGLVFGATYEILPFMIGNAGALPAFLREPPAAGAVTPPHPAVLRSTPLAVDDAPAELVRKATYRRLSYVSAPAPYGKAPLDPVASPSAATDRIVKSEVTLAIPEGVFPLAHEIDLYECVGRSLPEKRFTFPRDLRRRLSLVPGPGEAAWMIEIAGIEAQAGASLVIEILFRDKDGNLQPIRYAPPMTEGDLGFAAVLAADDQGAVQLRATMQSTPIAPESARDAEVGLLDWVVLTGQAPEVVTCKLASPMTAQSLARFTTPVLRHPLDHPPTPQRPQLLLLAEKSLQRSAAATHIQDEHTFEVRLPSVDLLTWDRSFRPAQPNNRAPAPRSTPVAAHDPETRKTNWKSQLDTSKSLTHLIDPAVGEELFVELIPQFTRPHLERDGIPIPLVTRVTCGFADALKRGCATIAIRVGSSGAKLVPRIAALNVEVPSGEVWELRMYAIVAGDRFGSVFPKSVSDRFTMLPESPSESPSRLGPPMRVLIEVAPNLCDRVRNEKLSPTPKQLWDDLIAKFEVDRYALDLASSAENRGRYAYFSQVEVRRQLFRWNGQPLPSFYEQAAESILRPPNGTDMVPIDGFTATINGETHRAPPKSPTEEAHQALGMWEIGAFRDDAIFATHPTTLRPPRLGISAALPQRLCEIALAGDTRGHYVRFSAVISSRYAGLEKQRFLIAAFDSAESSPAFFRGAWKRLVLPCTAGLPVPKPSIRAILPLTSTWVPIDAPPDERALQGVLVLLDEPLYQVGGIAEQIVARVGTAQWPGNDETKESIAQVGEDPAVVFLKRSKERAIADAGLLRDAFRIYPPLGLTHDVESAAPRIIGAVIVIALDGESLKKAGSNAAQHWPFAQFIFHRRIVIPDAGASRHPDRALFTEIISEPSDAAWAQVLPDPDRLLDELRPSSVRLSQSTASKYQLKIADPNPAQATKLQLQLKVRLDELRTGSRHMGSTGPIELFDAYLLATWLITDSAGRNREERYLGVFSFDPTWSWQDDGVVPLTLEDTGLVDGVRSSRNIILRTLRSQRSTTGQEARATHHLPFWDRFFDTSKDVTERIVGVSSQLHARFVPSAP